MRHASTSNTADYRGADAAMTRRVLRAPAFGARESRMIDVEEIE